MAKKKKKSTKRTKKTSKTKKSKPKNNVTWEHIGKLVGKRIEKESESCSCFPGSKMYTWTTFNQDKGGHFIAALVFAVTVLWTLSTTGVLPATIPWWIQVILALSFAFMFS